MNNMSISGEETCDIVERLKAKNKQLQTRVAEQETIIDDFADIIEDQDEVYEEKKQLKAENEKLKEEGQRHYDYARTVEKENADLHKEYQDIAKHLNNSLAENEDLRRVCQECLDWFDKISRYQDQRLGHGLKEACQNWAEASEIDIFDFSEMRQVLNQESDDQSSNQSTGNTDPSD